MEYVIQYDDGDFNYGPEDSNENGFRVQMTEASIYSSRKHAEDKLKYLLAADGTGAKIILHEKYAGGSIIAHRLKQLIRDYGRARFDNRGDAAQKYMEEITSAIDFAIQDEKKIKDHCRENHREQMSNLRGELVRLEVLPEEKGMLHHEGRADPLTVEAELMFHGDYFMAILKQKMLNEMAKEFDGCGDSMTGDQIASMLRSKGNELVRDSLPNKD